MTYLATIIIAHDRPHHSSVTFSSVSLMNSSDRTSAKDAHLRTASYTPVGLSFPVASGYTAAVNYISLEEEKIGGYAQFPADRRSHNSSTRTRRGSHLLSSCRGCHPHPSSAQYRWQCRTFPSELGRGYGSLLLVLHAISLCLRALDS